MNFQQTSVIVDKTEKESLYERVSLVEDKLKEIKSIYQNYKENSEALQDDVQFILADTEMWMERTRQIHEEARIEKERHRRLRYVLHHSRKIFESFRSA